MLRATRPLSRIRPLSPLTLSMPSSVRSSLCVSPGLMMFSKHLVQLPRRKFTPMTFSSSLSSSYSTSSAKFTPSQHCYLPLPKKPSFSRSRKRFKYKILAATTTAAILYNEFKKQEKEQAAEHLLTTPAITSEAKIEVKPKKAEKIDITKLTFMSRLITVGLLALSALTGSILVCVLGVILQVSTLIYKLIRKFIYADNSVYNKTLNLAEKKYPNLHFDKGGNCFGLTSMWFVCHTLGRDLETIFKDTHAALIAGIPLTPEQHALIEDVAYLQKNQRELLLLSPHEKPDSHFQQLVLMLYKYFADYQIIDLNNPNAYEETAHATLKKAILHPSQLIPLRFRTTSLNDNGHITGVLYEILYDGHKIQCFDGSTHITTSDVFAAKKQLSNEFYFFAQSVAQTAQHSTAMIAVIDRPLTLEDDFHDIYGENRATIFGSLFHYNEKRLKQIQDEDLASMLRQSGI